MNADGTADDTGWVHKNDGILVLDRNANGVVDGTGEMSFVGDLPGARSSLEGLNAFDSNRDGLLDERDEKFGEFRIWQDANGDGLTNSGELKTLAEAGIASIGVRGRANDRRWQRDQNVIINTATFTRTNGATGTVGDVALAYKPAAGASLLAGESSSAIQARLAALRAGLGRWSSASGPTLLDGFDFETDFDASETKLVDRVGAIRRARFGDAAATDRSTALPTHQPGLQSRAAGSLLGKEGAVAVNGADPGRVALLVQQMASFGARAGESALKERSSDPAHYDYFAS